MTDPKLKPLHRDTAFWIMLTMSLPGIIAIFVAAWDGILTGTFDPGAFQSGFLAIPVVGYLLVREYPRGKSVEAAGLVLASGRDERMAQQFSMGFDAAAGFDNPDAMTDAPLDENAVNALDEVGEDPNLFVAVTNPSTGESFTVPGEVAALMDAEDEPTDGDVIDEPDDGFGEVSTGGAHYAVNTIAEHVDASAKERRIAAKERRA